MLAVEAQLFPIPVAHGAPVAIADGPDGNLWVTENGPAGGVVVRVAPDGSMAAFPDPSGLPVRGIAAGPGGLWFVEAGPSGTSRIGRIAPDGTISEFPAPDAQAPDQIAEGPDGNLWFTQAQALPGGGSRGILGRMTPSGLVAEFPLPSGIASLPTAIAAGADGNLWFTDGAGKIGRITPGGTIAEFAVPSPNTSLYGIAAGADGNLWFTEFDAGKVGRITPDGQVTEYAMPAPVNPTSIVLGADGNLWFVADGMAGGRLGRITPAGIVTLYDLPSGVSSSLQGVAPGPSGTLWFADVFNNAIVRADPNAPLPSTPIFNIPAGVPGSSQASGGPASSTPAPPSAPLPVPIVVAHGRHRPLPKHQVSHPAPKLPPPHHPAWATLAAQVARLRRFAIAHGAHPYP